MTTTPIRVLIADDHAIVRKGIMALLAREADIAVIGEASDGQEAIDRAAVLHSNRYSLLVERSPQLPVRSLSSISQA